MEKSEQRFVMKFLFIKGLSAKAIHREVTGVLAAPASSRSRAKERRSRFAAGHFCTKAKSGPDFPVMF
jgi:hypothetical protein